MDWANDNTFPVLFHCRHASHSLASHHTIASLLNPQYVAESALKAPIGPMEQSGLDASPKSTTFTCVQIYIS
jgi:hypothetical protein